MFFTIDELVRWLGLTVFEIWVHLCAFLIFTIRLPLLYDDQTSEEQVVNWWSVFLPLFAGDAICAYFCVIVFIRMLLETTLKTSILRFGWSLIFLAMLFKFKYFLCRKLLGQITYEYSEVFAPLYVLLQLIAIRACQLN